MRKKILFDGLIDFTFQPKIESCDIEKLWNKKEKKRLNFLDDWLVVWM